MCTVKPRSDFEKDLYHRHFSDANYKIPINQINEGRLYTITPVKKFRRVGAKMH